MTTTLSRPPAQRPHGIVPSPRARAVDQAWIVGVATAVGALVTVGMWLRHGGVVAASGPGGTATAAGQVSALLGTYAVLGELLLMSRVAWLERAIGLDRLAVWHRWTGFGAVWLLVAHVVFTTMGWAASSIPSVNVVHETGWLVSHEPDILMAWVGFMLFLAVGATSVRLARRELKRESWYFVHLYAYLAVALTFAHQLAVGSDFTSDPVARAWWALLFAAVFGAILWWRVMEPVLLNTRHRLRVHGVQVEAPGVVSIYLTGRNLDRLRAQPGQFFMWRFLTRDGWWQPHPFSLSAAPTPKRLRITVKDLGDGTADLMHLRRGTRALAEGPYSTFTAARRTGRPALLVAGGIGVTPLRALLDTFAPADDVVLLYRIQHANEVIFADELRRFANERGVTVHFIAGTEIGDDNTDLLSVRALRKGVPNITQRDCFVCGPPGFIDAICRRLRKLRVPDAQIHYERFEL